MASTYSSALRFELIATGEQANTWGATTNINLGTLIEQSIAGYTTVSMATDADRTLTTSNGASDEARPAALRITSAVPLTTTRNVICPSVNKIYSVRNATTGGRSIVFKTAAGSGITIPNGETAYLLCDGTNVVYGFSAAGMGLLSAASTLAVANGGTGITSSGTARNVLISNGSSWTSGAFDVEGADVASATTTNIWATDGNTRHITGNTTITSFGTAPAAGARMRLIFDGTPLLTHSANLNLNYGSNNVQIEAGDYADVYADTTTQFDVIVTRKSGAALLATGATGGGTDTIFYLNGKTVTANYTLAATSNAMTAGPITINNGVTVTISDGATWTVV